MLLKQAQLLGGSIRRRYNSIVVFVTDFQASQTSSLILQYNSVTVLQGQESYYDVNFWHFGS